MERREGNGRDIQAGEETSAFARKAKVLQWKAHTLRHFHRYARNEKKNFSLHVRCARFLLLFIFLLEWKTQLDQRKGRERGSCFCERCISAKTNQEKKEKAKLSFREECGHCYFFFGWWVKKGQRQHTTTHTKL